MSAFLCQEKGKGHQETISDNDEVTWDREKNFQNITAVPAILLLSSYPDC